MPEAAQLLGQVVRVWGGGRFAPAFDPGVLTAKDPHDITTYMVGNQSLWGALVRSNCGTYYTRPADGDYPARIFLN